MRTKKVFFLFVWGIISCAIHEKLKARKNIVLYGKIFSLLLSLLTKNETKFTSRTISLEIFKICRLTELLNVFWLEDSSIIR